MMFKVGNIIVRKKNYIIDKYYSFNVLGWRCPGSSFVVLMYSLLDRPYV